MHIPLVTLAQKCHNLGWRTARAFFENNIFRFPVRNARPGWKKPPDYNGLLVRKFLWTP
jgi:hypothetical protein